VGTLPSARFCAHIEHCQSSNRIWLIVYCQQSARHDCLLIRALEVPVLIYLLNAFSRRDGKNVPAISLNQSWSQAGFIHGSG